MEHSLKTRMKNGENLLGTIIGDYSPSMVEIYGHIGFDFVFIDDEHGAFSYSELENMVRASDAVNISPIARVSYDKSSIQKVLDRGFKGIHVPMVNTKKDAEGIVESAKFPPKGKRGVAYYIRAAQYGKLGGKEYLESVNNENLIIVHIETPQAVKNIDEIINVPGIDMIFIGIQDLSVSMGYEDEVDHPEFQSVINELYNKGQEKGILIGTVASNKIDVIQAFERGANYVAVVGNSIIFSAFSEIINVKNTFNA